MSLEAITWAYKTEVGSPTRKAVLLVLANYADADDASSYPGRSRIEQMTELKTTAVKDALRDLESMGVVAKEPRTRYDGSSSSNRYVINMQWAGGSPDDPSPLVTDDPQGSADDPRTDTKHTRKSGTANPMPAARVEPSGPTSRKRSSRRTVADDGEGLASIGGGDKTPAPEEPKRGLTVGSVAKDFERSCRAKYPLGDGRRVTNLTALRANISRWRDQDGFTLEQIAAAMEEFHAGNYVRDDGEPWRRFINVFARMHDKASAPDITDPAYYTDSQEKENIEWTVEAWLEAQGQPSSGPS